MAKKTKKTTEKETIAVQVEKSRFEETEPILTQESIDLVNVPQIESGEELQKLETENVPEQEPSEKVLDSEPENDAVLKAGQCPRCKHINSNRAFIFPGVNRVTAPGVYEGVKYQIVETRRTKCEKCGQLFFIKKYL
jgi:hypothetical protein